DHQLHPERLRFRLVAHSLDLERLREPLGDAVHHVGDERAGEPMERLVPALIGGSPYDNRLALHRHGQLGVDQPADLALRPLHGNPRPVELSGYALGNGDRLPADARHGPASLPDHREQLAADAGGARFAVRAPAAAAALAPVVAAHVELRLPLDLLHPRLLRHDSLVSYATTATGASPRKGIPSSRSRARAVSSRPALVTSVISIPWIFSTLS